MANFEAKITAQLDLTAARSDLNNFIAQAQKPIKFTADFSNINQAIQSALSNVQSQAGSAGSSAGNQFARQFQSSLSSITTNFDKHTIGNILGSYGLDSASISKVTKDLDKLSVEIGKITTKETAKGTQLTISASTKDLKTNVKLVSEFNNKTNELTEKSRTITQNFGQAMNNVGKSVQQAQTKVKQFNQTQAETFGNQMSAWAMNNSKAVRAYGDELSNLQQRLRVAITNKDADAVKQIREEFRLLQSEARATGNIGKTFGESFTSALGSVTRFAASYLSIYRVFNTLKEGTKTIVELDDALVDLQKTSTATPQQLGQFYKEANDYAKEYGATTQQMIQGAADWSRLGYNLEESKEMSKLSSQFASISPGMSVEESTEGLVSTMKAFGVETDDVLDGIMSKVNAVGNGFALTNADIMTALKNSSSAMAAANNSLDETIALITAGTEIVQDASKVGNGLRTGFCAYVQKCA